MGDVGMIERGEELRFPAEAREAIGIVGDGGEQDFDRDVAIQLRVPRAIHFAHPAGADGSKNFVRADPRPGGQRRWDPSSHARSSSAVIEPARIRVARWTRSSSMATRIAKSSSSGAMPKRAQMLRMRGRQRSMWR